MKTNHITNIVIVVLVVAAVLQTNQLWLAGTTSHAFFYENFDWFGEQETAEIGENALLSTKYAIGNGATNFQLYYPDKTGTSEVLQTANTVVQEILSENIGKDIERFHVDWKYVLQKDCLVLPYEFSISMDAYLENIRSLRNGQDLSSFDTMILAPAKTADAESFLYFIDAKTNEGICYVSHKSKTASVLFSMLQYETQQDMVYISTGQKTGSAVLKHNLFLPQFSTIPYRYATISLQPAFEENQALSRYLLENTAEHFFDNFSVDWSTRDENGNFIFSDSSVVLKYYPATRVLEYYNYDNYGSDGKTNALLDGYQVCLNFLKHDTSLQTGIYLADVAENGNERIYYFDYAINDLPIRLSEETKNDLHMAHAIEITVQNNSVKKYRRYAVNFVSSQSKNQSLEVQFIDALDDANGLYQQTIGQREIAEVQNIVLAYDASTTTEIPLCWFVTLYEQEFAIPVTKQTTE